jgi:hypothetical protein
MASNSLIPSKAWKTISVTALPKSAPVRQIEVPEREQSGLVIEPRSSYPKVLLAENHNRERFVKKCFYSDPYAGDGRTYDPAGRYNCGACNQAKGKVCQFVKLNSLDLEAGSCEVWENICAGDPEVFLQCMSGDAADYGVALNGKGFGCHRCPYSSVSVRGPDSQGRSRWCGKGAFRVFDTACCKLNGAVLKKGVSDG